MTGFERGTLRWAKVAVFMSALAAIFVCLQWWEMHTGGQDTHDLAVAAKTQAEKMKDMSDAAEKIRIAAEGMVVQEKEIADNAKKALDASNRQSKASLDANIAQFRNEQRAWVGPTSVSPFELKSGAGVPVITIPVKNSGKTPAFKFRSHITFRSLKKGEPFQPIFGAVPVPASMDVVQPNQEILLPIGPLGIKLTDQNIADLKNGNMTLYIYGEGSYSDIFSRKHHFSFCLRVDPDLRSTDSCETYNQAD